MLSKFNLYPEYHPNCSRHDISLGKLESGLEIVIRMSSAYKHILCSFPLNWSPDISTSSLIAWASGSMNSAKSVGLKGHHWRHPRYNLIELETFPFILTCVVGK